MCKMSTDSTCLHGAHCQLYFFNFYLYSVISLLITHQQVLSDGAPRDIASCASLLVRLCTPNRVILLW